MSKQQIRFSWPLELHSQAPALQWGRVSSYLEMRADGDAGGERNEASVQVREGSQTPGLL